jgi:hypothetical protein
MNMRAIEYSGQLLQKWEARKIPPKDISSLYSRYRSLKHSHDHFPMLKILNIGYQASIERCRKDTFTSNLDL